MIGGNAELLPIVEKSIVKRIEQSLNGVVAETRSATMEAKTIFMRPRAGSARMYPETDIPPIEVNDHSLEKIKQSIPLSWTKIIENVSKKYNINYTLAENIYDSRYFDLFETISSSTLSNSFVVSKLTEDLTNFERQGYDLAKLNDSTIVEIFQKVDRATLAKESIPIIFEKILNGESNNVDHAIGLLGIRPLSDNQIIQTIKDIIEENRDLISEKGDRAIGLLMGRCMSLFRGKVDGVKINSILREELNMFNTNTKK
jgi:glutamyl-tRNA(Gln) amidotransferase subunit E